jgi:hypothetical protein
MLQLPKLEAGKIAEAEKSSVSISTLSQRPRTDLLERSEQMSRLNVFQAINQLCPKTDREESQPLLNEPRSLLWAREQWACQYLPVPYFLRVFPQKPKPN